MAVTSQQRPTGKVKEKATLTTPTEIKALLDTLTATVEERLSSLRVSRL